MNKIIKISLAILLIACMLFPLSLSLPVEAQGESIAMTAGFNVSGSNGGQQIPIGSTIQHFKDGSTKVFNSDSSLILTTSDANSRLVATADGYQKADRIYGVPSGTLVNHNGNILKCYHNNQLILTVIDAASNNMLGAITYWTFQVWQNFLNNNAMEAFYRCLYVVFRYYTI